MAFLTVTTFPGAVSVRPFTHTSTTTGAIHRLVHVQQSDVGYMSLTLDEAETLIDDLQAAVLAQRSNEQRDALVVQEDSHA